MKDAAAVLSLAFRNVARHFRWITAVATCIIGIGAIVVGNQFEARAAHARSAEESLRAGTFATELQVVGLAFIAVPLLTVGLSLALRFRKELAEDDNPYNRGLRL